jgi:TPR repeat protein
LVYATIFCGIACAQEQDFTNAEKETIRAVELLQNGTDSEKANSIKTLGKLSDSGFAPAMQLLGLIYQEGSYGVEKDEKKGFTLIKDAADLDYVPAMVSLMYNYSTGYGVTTDNALAYKWAKKASQYASPDGWFALGLCYEYGVNVDSDMTEAASWYKKSAGGGYAPGQYYYALCLSRGTGLPQDEAMALNYYQACALQNYPVIQGNAQYCVATAYLKGEGVKKSLVEGLAWLTIAAENGQPEAVDFLKNVNATFDKGDQSGRIKFTADVNKKISSIKRGISTESYFSKKLAPWSSPKRNPGSTLPGKVLKWSGTGFFITNQGHLITNNHVAPAGAQVKVVTQFGAFTATVLKTDTASDISLLKVDGMFKPIALVSSNSVKLGATVATLGFPNTELQGFSPKLTKGEISSLLGARDDLNCFQISTPVQPGNSGGALFDKMGNAIGVVVAKISQRAALENSGTLAENVNYAVKSDIVLNFLQSEPEVCAKLAKPNSTPANFEDTVSEVEKSIALILVY